MQKIQRSALVAYSAQQMFELVDDIEKYPEFILDCKEAVILARDQGKVSATLQVSKKGIAKSFSTENTLEPYQKIRMELLDGPFTHLAGEWRFKALSDQACKIELDLEFEFSNKIASVAFTQVFNHLVQSMVAAFTERAQKIYD